jgi:regulator of telomere elongation helicase 1
LCLLCATLAWRRCGRHKVGGIAPVQLADTLQIWERWKQLNSDPSSAQAIAKQEAATAAGVQLNWADQLKAAYAEAHAAGEIRVPPVIYSSRTHSQLAQVLRELKRTSYR